MGLEIFDGTLRSGSSKILNVDITDVGWVQASLPVREGGLGIRSAALLAPSAFLASAASKQELQSQILHACNLGTDVAVARTISVWQARYQTDEPGQDSIHRQSSWDKAAIDHAVRILYDSRRDERDMARLHAVRSPHSDDWLHALPISARRLRLDDETVRVAIGLRLGVDICEPHICPCGSLVDWTRVVPMVCPADQVQVAHRAMPRSMIWFGVRCLVPTSHQ